MLWEETLLAGMGLKEAPATPNMTKLGGMTGFKSVGQIYQLSTSKDNKKFFAAALADAVSQGAAFALGAD